MKFLVFGSANIDRTYTVSHFVHAGETLATESMKEYCGGKGFNQALALARAGAEVSFAGAIGPDGGMLADRLTENGVNISHLMRVEVPTGHAVIQVTPEGENAILISAGANASVTREYADRVLSSFSEGDMILLQNEIPHIPYILQKAHERGMRTALNPSPYHKTIEECDLSLTDYLLLNRSEGAMLSGKEKPEEILNAIHDRYPSCGIVLTLGEAGSAFMGRSGAPLFCGRYQVKAVDTTGAGDTFTGFFLAEEMRSFDTEKALRMAAVASGLCVTGHGAAASIPRMREVEEAAASLLMPFSREPYEGG